MGELAGPLLRVHTGGARCTDVVLRGACQWGGSVRRIGAHRPRRSMCQGAGMGRVEEVCYRRGRTGGAESATERLLTVANELFCREGINATGIKRVLDESGVARRPL